MMRRGNLLMRKKSPNKWNNEPQYYHWTTSAIQCYMRGCVCDGCFYSDFFNGSSQKCQMKASVLELVRVLGKPDVELQQLLVDELE